MPYNPNPNWVAAIDDTPHFPVYYVVIDGWATHYSTAPVKDATPDKKIYLDLPEGGEITLDLINSRPTRQQITVPILDVDDEITNLVAWQNPNNTLGTLINRKLSLYAGYRHLTEADYAPIFVGRIRGVALDPDGRRYVLLVQDIFNILDKELMANATPTKNALVSGNVINVVWSLLTGIFDTAHADFPLVAHSSDGEFNVAPTGANIARADIDEVLLKSERDTWHPDDRVSTSWQEPINLNTELLQEFYRVFQARPVMTETGKIGFRFRTPALPSSSAPTLDQTQIVQVLGWSRLIREHLNKFTIHGDHDVVTGLFDTVLYRLDTSEDTADRTASQETRELFIESKWLKTFGSQGNLDEANGQQIASELSGRSRFLFLPTPVTLSVEVIFAKRDLQIGEPVRVTDPRIPNLQDGTRGVQDVVFLIAGITPDFGRGTLVLDMIDTRFRRYGVIGADSLPVYDSATSVEQNTFCWWGRASDNKVGAALDPGYRIM